MKCLDKFQQMCIGATSFLRFGKETAKTIHLNDFLRHVPLSNAPGKMESQLLSCPKLYGSPQHREIFSVVSAVMSQRRRLLALFEGYVLHKAERPLSKP